MKAGYLCITVILGLAFCLQLGAAGLSNTNPLAWSIFGTAAAIGGVFYKWGDEV